MAESAGIGYDATFELNEFNEPKIKSEVEVIRDTVLYILFSKPGQYPSLPQIGLNISPELYEFYDTFDTEELKNKIIAQCEAMGVCFSSGMINIRKMIYKNTPSLLITINGDSTYPSGYMSDSSTDQYMIGITFNQMKQMVYSISSPK